MIFAAQAAKQQSDKTRELRHTFRAPETRPRAVVSYIFTILVLAPLAWLLYSLSTVGLNLRFPSGVGYIWTMLFQLSILSILLLFIVYWAMLNIFQALVGLALLGLVALFTGNQALRASSTDDARAFLKVD